MNDELANIWDEPLAEAPIVIEDDDDDVPAPASRRTSSLFLPGTDDENSDNEAASKAKPPDDIDALFDEELAEEPAAVRPNREKQILEAQARHARSMPATPIMSSSHPRDTGEDDKAKGDDAKTKDDKKPKKKIMRLDEARLLGPTGFPQLIKDTKYFKPKGKGHEATDLNRLLQKYQFWTHKLYPKTQFKDTVDRVEKLTHSRRMTVSLSVWRDEAHGTVNGMKPTEDVIDLTSDAEREDEPQAQPTVPKDVDIDLTEGNESDQAAYASSSSIAPSHPPSSSDVDMDEIDALIRNEEEMEAESSKLGAKKSAATEDDDMWAEFDDNADLPVKAVQPNNRNTDDDDMWDIVQEMENEQRDSNAVAPLAAATATPAPPTDPTADDDWDDMYV